MAVSVDDTPCKMNGIATLTAQPLAQAVAGSAHGVAAAVKLCRVVTEQVGGGGDGRGGGGGGTRHAARSCAVTDATGWKYALYAVRQASTSAALVASKPALQQRRQQALGGQRCRSRRRTRGGHGRLDGRQAGAAQVSRHAAGRRCARKVQRAARAAHHARSRARQQREQQRQRRQQRATEARCAKAAHIGGGGALWRSGASAARVHEKARTGKAVYESSCTEKPATIRAFQAAMHACGSRACAPVARRPQVVRTRAARHQGRRPAPPPRAAAAPAAAVPAPNSTATLGGASVLPLPAQDGPSERALTLRAFLHYDGGGPRFFSPLLPQDAARPAPESLPLLIYLPGA